MTLIYISIITIIAVKDQLYFSHCFFSALAQRKKKTLNSTMVTERIINNRTYKTLLVKEIVRIRTHSCSIRLAIMLFNNLVSINRIYTTTRLYTSPSELVSHIVNNNKDIFIDNIISKRKIKNH